MSTKHVSRREFLSIIGLGAATLAARGMRVDQVFNEFGNIPFSAQSPENILIKLHGKLQALSRMLKSTCEQHLRWFLSCRSATQVMTYQATLVKGLNSNLISLPDNYLGPIIRVHQGQRLKVNFTNSLPEIQPFTFMVHVYRAIWVAILMVRCGSSW